VESKQPTTLYDLLLVVVLGVIAAGAVYTTVVPGPVRTASTLIFALFAPGYVITTALLPARKTVDGKGNRLTQRDNPEQEDTNELTTSHRVIDGLERIAFSIGTSVAIVLLTGMGLGIYSGGIRPETVLGVLLLVTGVALVPSVIQRRELDPEESPVAPAALTLKRFGPSLFNTSNKARLMLNILTIVIIIGALGSVTYGYVDTDDGLTEFYLLSEGPDGEELLGEYPESLSPGEEERFIIVINNQEDEQVNYTLVVKVREEVQFEGDLVSQNETRLLTEQFSLADNRTERISHKVSTKQTAGRVRLTYLLYVGNPPADPTSENAYRELHLWLPISR